MIARDPPAAACQRHDLVVVGGGIYGVCVALEAARRGLCPLLIERGDFGGATSWNSLRIIHGGLRYLQTADLPRFRESVGERSWFLREFPDLVRPIECLMPLYGRGLKRPGVLGTALRVNDLLSRRRNDGIRADRAIGSGRVLSALETVARFPGVERTGLEGGALWYDAVMTNSQRLLIELLHWACAAGAVALNYVEARTLVRRSGAVAGLMALDRASGEALEFDAPIVVNCAGPWGAALAQRLDPAVVSVFHPSLGFNLLLDRPPLSAAALAVAPPARGSRVYFMYPWHGKVLAGTYHAPWAGPTDDVVPSDECVARCLGDLNAAVPGWDLATGDILRVHAGLLPALAAGSEALTSREVIQDHGMAGGATGLFGVSGVKFTTARLVAEKTVRLLARRHSLPLLPPRTPRPAAEPVVEWEGFKALVDSTPDEAAAYVRELSARESVLQLDDLLLRRTDWAMTPMGSDTAARYVAGLSVFAAAAVRSS